MNQQSGEKIKYRSDWRVVAVVCFTLLLVAGLFIALHQYAWYLITATQYVELGQILIASIYVAMIGALFITIIIAAFYFINKARMAGLVNIFEHQLTIDDIKNNYASDMLKIGMERANKSIFQGISTLTLDVSKSSTNTNNNAESLQEEIADIEDDIMPQLFKDLQEKGLIGRSGNSILIGVANDEGE